MGSRRVFLATLAVSLERVFFLILKHKRVSRGAEAAQEIAKTIRASARGASRNAHP